MKIKNQKLQNIKNWVKTHKIKAGIIAAIIISLSAGGIYYILSQPLPEEPTEEVVANEEPPKPKPKYYSQLSGLELASEAEVAKPVIGVMIENSPAARPQSGLKAAGVVLEAIAEAGVTRFLALYQNEAPDLIGPVRSVRGYYVDWAGGFDTSIAHVGGSYDALQRVRDGQHKDIDQFFNSGSFWRSTDRYAPHNVYTNFDNLTNFHQAKGWTTSTFESFPRQNDESTTSEEVASSINMNISGYQYNVNYVYNSETGLYWRNVAGEPHNDREAGQITPKTVIAMKVNMFLDADGYHNHITTSGSGEAFVFQDGKVIRGHWAKEGEYSPLKFLDSENQPIKLNRGQTWITAIPNNSGSVGWE